MKVEVLSSGSKGNTTFVETENTKLLLDCGNTCKYICEKLKEINLSIDNNQMRKYEVKCKLNELPDYTKKIKKLLDLNKPKKELVHSLIDRIVINKDRVITIQYKYGVIPDNTFTYKNLNLARNPYGRKGKNQYSK